MGELDPIGIRKSGTGDNSPSSPGLDPLRGSSPQGEGEDLARIPVPAASSAFGSVTVATFSMRVPDPAPPRLHAIL